MKPPFPAAIAACLVLLTACGTLPTRRPSPMAAADPEAARAVLGRLVRLNAALDTFKGIGRAVYVSGERRESAGVAWMGAGRERVRIELLDPAGRPALSFATDGEYSYLRSRQPPRFHRRRNGGSDLSVLFGLPLRPADIVALMAGRAPLRPHRTVRLLAGDPDAPPDGSAGGSVLVLERFWGVTAQKIYFDGATEEIRRVEVFDHAGGLAYRAVFEAMRPLEGYRVPAALSVTDGKGVSLRLEVRRFWANVPVEPSRFVLEPPAAAGGRP